MTKQLDTEVFMRILHKGEWSIVRDEEFINPKTKKSSKRQQQQPQPLARGPGAAIDPAPGGQAGHRSETDAPERPRAVKAQNSRIETKKRILPM